MTQLILKTGDIFTSDAGALGHGVNVRGVMGAGIALQFRNKFPSMYDLYTQWCSANILLPGESMVWYDELSNLFICNIASQDNPGPFARMDWLISGVGMSLRHLEEVGVETLALPRIGSGIGGLNEKDVEDSLRVLAEYSSVDIELWTYGGKP